MHNEVGTCAEILPGQLKHIYIYKPDRCISFTPEFFSISIRILLM